MISGSSKYPSLCRKPKGHVNKKMFIYQMGLFARVDFHIFPFGKYHTEYLYFHVTNNRIIKKERDDL